MEILIKFKFLCETFGFSKIYAEIIEKYFSLCIILTTDKKSEECREGKTAFRRFKKKRGIHMRNRTHYILCAAVLACAFSDAQAAPVSEYDLDPVIVTANRYLKKDIEVAASTQTYTAKDIEQSGGDNMLTALQYMDGLVQNGRGPNGASFSTMTSKLMIRGVEYGTVVMLNGTPINWRNMYNLENIPTEAVERVEVIRGGAAVMHGSQATGGVINIITKKEMPNSVRVGFGKFGRRDYKVALSEGGFSIAYSYNKWGETGVSSDYFTTLSKKGPTVHMQNHFLGSEKNDVFMTYKINDKFDILYNHNESSSHWNYQFSGITDPSRADLNGVTRYTRTYDKTKDFAQFNFRDLSGLSGHVFFNRDTLSSDGLDYYSSSGKKNATPSVKTSSETNRTYGFDIQKVWNTSERHTFLVGGSLIREMYKSGEVDLGRNVLSLFGSWEGKLTKKDILSAGLRWTRTSGADENFRNLSGQAQYLHKISENESFYVSAGQSFVLPTLSQMYSHVGISDSTYIVGNPDLKPQKGTHYEIGWKKETKSRQYKLALFSERIKDNISFSQKDNLYYTINENFKNRGIEFSVRAKPKSGFTWHLGITYQDPKSIQLTEKSSVKDYWDRSLGRWVVTGGLGYEKGKWSTAINFTYLADRVMCPSDAHSYSQKPYLLTGFTAKYSPNAESDITLSIDNLLSRRDVISHSSSEYYASPFNYLVSYSYKF